MVISPFKKCLSKSLAIALSTFLILISFGIIVTGKYFEDLMNQQFNSNLDCSYLEYTIPSVQKEYFDINLGKRSRVLTYCFCKAKVAELGISEAYDYVFPAFPNVFPCRDYIGTMISFNAVIYGITVAIPVLNGIITLLLTYLTKKEKNKSLTQDKNSNMLKIFIGQFINTGLMLLLVNTRIKAVKNWNVSFPLLNGNYDDFDSGWFKNVGCTIFFAMILTIITPHLGSIIGAFAVYLKRLLDSGNSKGVGSKIKNMKAFMKLYVGPELPIDSRYAQVLNVFFVSLLYSSGIPGLYISMFFTLLLCYWVDKYLYIKFYKIPPKYDLSISKTFNSALLLGVSFHIPVAIWVYGSPRLLNDISAGNYDLVNSVASSLNIDLSDNSNFTTMVIQRVFATHNMVLTVILALFVAYFILRFTFLELIILISCKKGKSVKRLLTKSNNEETILNDLPLHAIYSIYEFRLLQLEKLNRSKKGKDSFYYEQIINKNLLNEKLVIKGRIKELIKIDVDLNDEDFNALIKTQIENLNVVDERGIKSDFSYNLAHIDEFRNVAIADYKMS